MVIINLAVKNGLEGVRVDAERRPVRKLLQLFRDKIMVLAR